MRGRKPAPTRSRLDRVSRDEDALRWEGDDELDRASVLDPQPGERDPEDALGARAASDRTDDRRRAAAPLRWFALALALVATAGWILVVVANPVEQPSLLGLAMYQLGELLAVVGPLAWWLIVDRVAPASQRGAWWLLGIAVTAPWPLVAGVLA